MIFKLFITFVKIGAMMFGGGYAMLPILQRELVENKGWVTNEELTDYFAVSQCTPGAIAVNTATFIGQKKGGVPGGIAATLGVVFPSLVIITIIAALISNFSDLAWVKNAFEGIRVCVCVLIFNAVLKLWKIAVVNKWSFMIYAVVLVGAVFTNLSPVLFVVVAAVLGIAVKSMETRKKC